MVMPLFLSGDMVGRVSFRTGGARDPNEARVPPRSPIRGPLNKGPSARFQVRTKNVIFFSPRGLEISYHVSKLFDHSGIGLIGFLSENEAQECILLFRPSASIRYVSSQFFVRVGISSFRAGGQPAGGCQPWRKSLANSFAPPECRLPSNLKGLPPGDWCPWTLHTNGAVSLYATNKSEGILLPLPQEVVT